MSAYKVLQDIEAEDKLVGPLSFRQCVYAAVAILNLYLCYLMISKHIAVFLLLFLPPALFCLFFAIPWQTQQSTEVWALAKIRFFFKPRRRVWDQSGQKELVTITVPKHIDIDYTNGLSQTEVSSRLKALAETIDSRGWAIKNVPMNAYNQPIFQQGNTDRLMNINDFAKEVPNYDESAAQDILDENINNPIAQQFDQMMTASKQAQRQHIIDTMHQASNPVAVAPPSSAVPYWFTNQYTTPAQPNGVLPQIPQPVQQPYAQPLVTGAQPIASQPTIADEAKLLDQIHTQNQQQALSSAHMRTIQPANAGQASLPPIQPEPIAPTPPVTPRIDPAILDLASNNDLNVATIAREANKHIQESPDEVVISLH